MRYSVRQRQPDIVCEEKRWKGQISAKKYCIYFGIWTRTLETAGNGHPKQSLLPQAGQYVLKSNALGTWF